MMQLLNGQVMAQAWRAQLGTAVTRFEKNSARPPSLMIILASDDLASRRYTDLKLKIGRELGVAVRRVELASPTEEDLLGTVRRLNQDADVDGYLIQFPLPSGINPSVIVNAIDRGKDADGLHPANLGEIAFGGRILPATAKGILRILEDSKIPLAGRRVVVLGRSRIVGLPIALACLAHDATVTICHTKTPDLEAYTQGADVIITATGQGDVLTPQMVKSGVVIIDAGFREVNGQGLGDINPTEFAAVAAAVTPTPGGVGPMTITALFDILLELAEARRDR